MKGYIDKEYETYHNLRQEQYRLYKQRCEIGDRIKEKTTKDNEIEFLIELSFDLKQREKKLNNCADKIWESIGYFIKEQIRENIELYDIDLNSIISNEIKKAKSKRGNVK